jgi:hypothetical protein
MRGSRLASLVLDALHGLAVERQVPSLIKLLKPEANVLAQLVKLVTFVYQPDLGINTDAESERPVVLLIEERQHGFLVLPGELQLSDIEGRLTKPMRRLESSSLRRAANR